MRAKVKLLCQDMGRAMQWNTELANDWIAHLDSSEQYFYCDGHVRVYHGDQTKLPRHHVAREKLCLRATVDYWINAMDGQPFLYVNKEVDPGLIATLKQDVIPRFGGKRWKPACRRPPSRSGGWPAIRAPTGSLCCLTAKATVRSCSRRCVRSGSRF